MEFATTQVWLAADSVIKCTRGAAKLRMELDFYADGAEHLPARTSRVLGSTQNPPALWLSRLAGRTVAGCADLQTDHIYFHAGKAVAQLHSTAFEDADLLSLDDALNRRFDGWYPRFEAVTEPALAAAVRSAWIRRAPLELNTRTRTHRDYSDRNWLWEPSSDEPLGVIDFEQSRPDHPWMDLTRLWERDFYGRDDLKEAFLHGYGCGSRVLEHPDFRTLGIQHAIATVAWATETGDAEYASIGRTALARWFEQA